MMSVVSHDSGPRQLAAFYCLEFRPLLDSEASRTADLQCGTALRENMSLATFKTKLKTYLYRCSQWLSKTTRGCCDVFAIPAPRYTWLYLLTYLLTYLLARSYMTCAGPFANCSRNFHGICSIVLSSGFRLYHFAH